MKIPEELASGMKFLQIYVDDLHILQLSLSNVS